MAYSGLGAIYPEVITFPLTGGAGAIVFGSDITTLYVDVNGNVMFGSNTGSAGSYGSGSNVSIGSSGLASTFPIAGDGNVAVGDNVLSSLTTGSGNLALGQGSGFYYTSSESNNILLNNPGVIGESGSIWIGAVGNQTTCYVAGVHGNNSFTGAPALVATDSVGYFGTTAPITYITGSETLIIGTYPGGTTGGSNTGFGYGVLASGSYGDQNTAIGHGALAAASGTEPLASYNTAVGLNAGGQITTGKLNTLVGFAAGYSYTGSESFNTCINAQGTIGDNSVLRLGDSTGTSDFQFSTAYVCGIQGVGVTGTAVLVSSSDQLGVAVSSERFKKEIQDMGSESDAIQQLRPRTFVWDRDSSPGLKDASVLRQFGLIAEEVWEVMPQLVNNDKDGRPLSVNYQDLISPILNELQKIAKRISQLENKAPCSCKEGS